VLATFGVLVRLYHILAIGQSVWKCALRVSQRAMILSLGQDDGLLISHGLLFTVHINRLLTSSLVLCRAGPLALLFNVATAL